MPAVRSADGRTRAPGRGSATRPRAGGRGRPGPDALLLATGLLVTGLTHVGYPVLARWAASRVRTGDRGGATPATGQAPLPHLTVVVPAHEEARFIEQKLHDTLAQDYPPELLEVLVVDDGSTDGTAELATAVGPPVRVVRQEVRQGKGAALNRGVAEARGEVVVFTDANGSLVPGSLRAVVAPFADLRVGVVGGTKRPVGSDARGAGESAYWRLENGLRTAESALGAVVGVDGGVYAVRRSAFRPVPAGVYADDYWIPLDALRRGWRVEHTSAACAVESVTTAGRHDFERRTRIAAGIWRESLRSLDLLHPRRGWVAVAFAGHRVLRTGVVPLLLPFLVPAAWTAGRSSRVARGLAVVQTGCWAAAASGALVPARALALPYQFALTNVAALRGGVRQLQRRQTALWDRTERGPWR